MILTKYVDVKINSSNFKRLKLCGYYFKNVGDVININVNDLSKGSNAKIIAKCYFCNHEKEVSYYNYLNQIKKGNKKYYCSKCKSEKSKQTNIKKYGVDNISKLDSIKKKKTETTFKNYGVLHTFHSEINKKKRIKTLFVKYGVYHNSQLEEYKEKRRNNCVSYDINYMKYKNQIRRLTKSNKNILFNNWNGYDYYDDEYIKDNFIFNFHNRLYPTIDHKISIYKGYIDNISPEIISNITNLCITKKFINSSKNKKTEKEYYEKN